MRGLNKVMLIGHLGKDPEVRYLEGGAAVANFSLATDESYKNKNGEKVQQTEWHNIVVWRQLAEIAVKYFKKGKLVYVEGRLKTRSWDDKEGHKKYTTEIIADNVVMLDKAGQGETANFVAEPSNGSKAQVTEAIQPPTAADDLPF